jgi:hypothetical protein
VEGKMQKRENLNFAVVLFEQSQVVAIQNWLLIPEERIDYCVFVDNLGQDGWLLIGVQKNHFESKPPFTNLPLTRHYRTS